MSLNLSPEQMEILAGMSSDQIQTLVNEARIAKERKDDLDAAKAFFTTVTNQTFNGYVQLDPRKYNALRTVLEKWSGEIFFVLYDTKIHGCSLIATDFELLSSEEMGIRFPNVDIKMINYLASEPIYLKYCIVNFHINTSGMPMQSSANNPRALNIFKDSDNLSFINRGDLHIIQRFQSDGFNIVPK